MSNNQSIISVPATQPVNPNIALVALSGGNILLALAILVGAGTIALGGAFAFAKAFRVIALPNEALIIMGGVRSSKPVVVIGGSAFVIPGIHVVSKVSLNKFETKADVTFYTSDMIHIKVEAVIFVRVNDQPESVLMAARLLGDGRQVDQQAINNNVEEQALDTFRTAIAQLTFNEITTNKEALTQRVQDLISAPLAKFGLEVTDVAAKNVNEATVEGESVLAIESRAAAAKRKNAATLIQDADDKATALALQQRDLETSRQQLELSVAKAREEAARKLERESIAAESERDVANKKAAEAQAIEQQRLELETQRNELQTAQAIATAQQAKNLQVRQTEQQREAKLAELVATQAVQRAEADQEIALAAAEQDKKVAQEAAASAVAEAETKRFAAEQRRIVAEAQVRTAQLTAEAERQKALALIEAARKAEEDRLKITSAAEAQATATVTEAEASVKKAELEAAALMKRTEAERLFGEMQAEITRLKNEAANSKAPEVLAHESRLELIRVLDSHLPSFIEKSPELLRALGIPEDALGGANVNLTMFSGGGEKGGSPAEVLLPLAGASVASKVVDILLPRLAGFIGGLGADAAPTVTPTISKPQEIAIQDQE